MARGDQCATLLLAPVLNSNRSNCTQVAEAACGARRRPRRPKARRAAARKAARRRRLAGRRVCVKNVGADQCRNQKETSTPSRRHSSRIHFQTGAGTLELKDGALRLRDDRGNKHAFDAGVHFVLLSPRDAVWQARYVIGAPRSRRSSRRRRRSARGAGRASRSSATVARRVPRARRERVDAASGRHRTIFERTPATRIPRHLGRGRAAWRRPEALVAAGARRRVVVTSTDDSPDRRIRFCNRFVSSSSIYTRTLLTRRRGRRAIG